MKTIMATVRFNRHGEYENSEHYDVEIPVDTKEDDEVEVIMDALRPILQDEFEDDEDWINGAMDWTLHTWQ
jgi:hypothetical protein